MGKKKKTLKEQRIDLTYEDQDIFSDPNKLISMLQKECKEEIQMYSDAANGVKTVYRDKDTSHTGGLSTTLENAIKKAAASNSVKPGSYSRQGKTLGGGEVKTPEVKKPVQQNNPAPQQTKATQTKPVEKTEAAKPVTKETSTPLPNWVSVINKPYRRLVISDFTKSQYVVPVKMEAMHELAGEMDDESIDNLIELTSQLVILTGHPHAIFTIEEFMEMISRDNIISVNETLFAFTQVSGIDDYVLAYYLDPAITRRWIDVINSEKLTTEEITSLMASVMLLANKHTIPDNTLMYAEYLNSIHEEMIYRQDWIEELIRGDIHTIEGQEESKVRIDDHEMLCANFTATIASFFNYEEMEYPIYDTETEDYEGEEEECVPEEEEVEGGGATNDDIPFHESTDSSSNEKAGIGEVPVTSSEHGTPKPQTSTANPKPVQPERSPEVKENKSENTERRGNPVSHERQEVQKEEREERFGSKPLGTSLGEKLKGIQIEEKGEEIKKEKDDDDIIIAVTRS